MPSVHLEWQQSGVYNSFNIYRSLSSINVNNLPVPIATTVEKSYVDLGIEGDKAYYYRVAAMRDNKLMVGDEVMISTSSDPNSAFLTNYLNFETATLFDGKFGSNWVANGSVGYINFGDKKALSISKPNYISAPNFLTASNSFTVILDITFLDEPTFPHQAIIGFTVASDPNESINIFRLNGSGIAVYKGSLGVVGSGVNLPNNTRLLLKIVKKSNGMIKFFINDVLINTQSFAYNIFANTIIQIGRNDADPGRGLNAIIHEFKYYHNKEID